MRISTVLLVLSFLSMPHFAVSATLTPTGQANESLRDAAKISGRVVAGIGFDAPVYRDPPVANVFIPASWKGETVCLETTSQDGRYQAAWEYVVDSAWEGGVVTAPILSDHKPYLSEQSPTSLAAVLRKSNCATFEGPLAPASWNQDDAVGSDRALRIRINSLRSDEAFLLMPDGSEVACTPVDENYRLAYDFECMIPAALVPKGAGEIEVLRLKSGRIQPSQVFTLYGAEAQ